MALTASHFTNKWSEWKHCINWLPKFIYHVVTNHITLINPFCTLSQDTDVENGLYQQMALTASHFAYSWSKWNNDSGTERIILQGCEKLEDDIPLDVSVMGLGL